MHVFLRSEPVLAAATQGTSAMARFNLPFRVEERQLERRAFFEFEAEPLEPHAGREALADADCGGASGREVLAAQPEPRLDARGVRGVVRRVHDVPGRLFARRE